MASTAMGAPAISARVSACLSASAVMSLACRICVATMAATACAVDLTSASQAPSSVPSASGAGASPIRASAHRHWPSTGTERASSTLPGCPSSVTTSGVSAPSPAVTGPILASSAWPTAPAGCTASTAGSWPPDG